MLASGGAAVFLLAISSLTPPASSGVRPLDGEWRYHAGAIERAPAALPTDWSSMTVPSNWHTEGLDVSGVVWFAKEVDFRAAGRFVAEFDAVDYDAAVFWDGEPVGSHRGYFAPFTVALPPVPGPGSHVLSVRVDSPLETSASWSLHKTLIKGVLSHHDTRPGGAWSPRGQDANTGGIWGAVRLREVRTGLISDIRAETVRLDADRAEVRLTAVIDSPTPAVASYLLTDGSGQVVARGSFGPAVQGVERRIETRLSVKHPKAWQPYERGRPHLYRLSLTLTSRAGVDSWERTLGLRTVTRDARGRFLVNGAPIFLRGTNYIGTLYYASLDRSAIRRDLRLMKAAHINAVRVHAHVASAAFYEVADEEGMLVWQDFPLQWGYEDTAAFHAEAVRQTVEMVSTLGLHPSIIFWSAHNEAPWSSDWMRYRYPNWDPDQNRALDTALEATLLREDPSRPAQGNSHTAEHAWFGWYSGTFREFAKPTPQVVLAEFGAQALPEIATLRTFLRDSELWPITGPAAEVWAYHNFQLEQLTTIAHVPVGRSVESLIETTQTYQARLLKFAAENLRRQKGQPVAAIFQFMWREHWPSVNWGIVDHLWHEKQGYKALALAYQPVLPMIWRKPGASRAAVAIINDLQAGYPGARLVALIEGGSDPKSIEFTFDVPADDVLRLIETLPLPARGQKLKLRLFDAGGVLLGENSYEFDDLDA